MIQPLVQTMLVRAAGREKLGRVITIATILSLFPPIAGPVVAGAILAAVDRRLGALALLPVHAFAGAGAHRLLISGVKGSKAPLRIAPALILHQADGRLTPDADAIHRGQAPIDWGAA